MPALSEQCQIFKIPFLEADVLPFMICFPCLCTLHWCDKREPSMDNILYFAHHADQAIKKSIEFRNDPSTYITEIHD